MSKWHPAANPPKNSHSVLIYQYVPEDVLDCGAYDPYSVGYYDPITFDWLSTDSEDYYDEVTHWRELPEPPI